MAPTPRTGSSRWIPRIRVAAFPLLDFILPSACHACAEPLGWVQQHGVCGRCWGELTPLPSPRCATCGLPGSLATDVLGPVRGRCTRCVLRPPAADSVRAVVAYDGAARAMLLRAKLACRRELLAPLARRLARAAQMVALDRRCTVVVPAPSHPWVTLRRGFSPAAEMARPVARALHLPLRRLALGKHWLGGRSVRGLGRVQRRERVAAIFARGRLDGDRVLLVDDVMTTGATTEACARVLRGAGAVAVHVLVWARTLAPEGARAAGESRAQAPVSSPARGPDAVVSPQRFDYSWRAPDGVG